MFTSVTLKWFIQPVCVSAYQLSHPSPPFSVFSHLHPWVWVVNMSHSVTETVHKLLAKYFYSICSGLVVLRSSTLGSTPSFQTSQCVIFSLSETCSFNISYYVCLIIFVFKYCHAEMSCISTVNSICAEWELQVL